MAGSGSQSPALKREISMKHPSRLRRFLALLVVPITVTTMFLAGADAAQASTPQSKPATQNTSSSDFEHACGQQLVKGRYACFTERRPNVDEPMVLSPDTTPAGYSPSNVQSAYNLPAAAGAPPGAIVDAYDDPNAESDLATYRAQYGLPACSTANGCFQKVAQDGSTNYPP